ncbi:hypothetical protein C8R47DRAFT_1134610 [Mycena vitilis]|nr:hypothetical protein C8R47DRAFT_1134610 [Mycena vitilis]
MNHDTLLIHLYYPASSDICPESMPVLTNTETQNLTAQSERCFLSDTCRVRKPLGAAAIQRVRKRRRVDSLPRQQSVVNPSSSSARSSSARSSSASISILTSTSTVSTASRSASTSAPSRSASRSTSSAHRSSASASNVSSSRSTTVVQSSSVSTSRTLPSSAFPSTHTASTSVFLSTVVVTATGSTITTAVAASSPALGTGESGGTPFSRNVGGIVGVAVGGVVALIVGAALIFFTCKGFKRDRSPEAEVELDAAPTQDQPAATELPSAEPRSSYHYTRAARPPMTTPPPSNTSLSAFIGRLRGGRASTSSSMPGALESTTPLSLPMPAFTWGAQSQRPPGTPPTGSPSFPPPRPPTPGSLLNPRVHVPSSPPSPAPEWVGWRTEPPPPPSALAPAQTLPDDPPRSPTGLLRPSLAVMQFESSRTLDDHQDYSRPIGGVRSFFFALVHTVRV